MQKSVIVFSGTHDTSTPTPLRIVLVAGGCFRKAHREVRKRDGDLKCGEKIYMYDL